MIQEWIYNNDITLDPFDTFRKREQCVELLLKKPLTTGDTDILVEHMLSCTANEIGVFYLDVCHWIFKDGRRHLDDLSHPVYGLLASFDRQTDTAIQSWLVQLLQATCEKQIVPCLVWMIDVLKLAAITDQGYLLLKKITSCEAWLNLVMEFWHHSHITVVRRSMELVHRWMIQQQSLDMDAVKKLIDYLNVVSTLTSAQLARLEDHDHTDFFYQPIGPLTLDRECLNLLIQITVASIHTIVQQQPAEIDPLLETTLHRFMAGSLPSTRTLLEFISNICGSNDQVMIRLQLDMLDIHLCLERHGSPGVLSPLLGGIDPHRLFIYFLYRTGMDHELVIDLLMSNETDMLLYLTRYLKYVERQPQAFLKAVDQVLLDSNDDGIHSVMGLLYQVGVVVRSSIFPYNASVLARRIDSVLECLRQFTLE